MPWQSLVKGKRETLVPLKARFEQEQEPQFRISKRNLVSHLILHCYSLKKNLVTLNVIICPRFRNMPTRFEHCSAQRSSCRKDGTSTPRTPKTKALRFICKTCSQKWDYSVNPNSTSHTSRSTERRIPLNFLKPWVVICL